MTPSEIRQIAESFAAARVEGRALAEYPGPFPQTPDDAYAIQLEAIALLGRPVLGWKVARLAADVAAACGMERIAGPVFDLWEADGGEPTVPIIEGGYVAAEAELQVQIRAIPERTGPGIEDTIGAVAIGIEAAGSPYPEINAHGPAVTISDFGNNAGLIVGPRVEAPSAWAVNSLLNGLPVGQGIAAGPFDAAGFLFEVAAKYGLPVSAGQWVSTGAITGAHRVRSGDRFEARFGDEASVACRFG